MDFESLIQKHLNKQLTVEEQLLFDDLLANNIDFKKELQFYLDLKLAIKTEEQKKLKKELQDLDITKNNSSLSKIMMIASLIGFIFISCYFIFINTSISNEKLYAENFKPYRNVLHAVVRSEDSISSIEKAFVYYENGLFNDFLSTIEKTNYINEDYNFYIANAYLAIDEIEKGTLILEKYIQQENNKFNTKAHWYLGLAYLKSSDITKAKKHFKIVINKDDFKTKEAIILLKKMN